MFYNFTTTTHGKWILAGEHAVIRQQPALVFPLPNKYFTLDYRADDTPVQMTVTGQALDQVHEPFWQTLRKGCQLTRQSFTELRGSFKLHNTIPVGAGMGASAALCVGVSRWFAAQQFIMTDTIARFAKELENLFHQQSSGLDIEGSAASQGLLFAPGHGSSPLTINWQPHWYLSFSGAHGNTAQCVAQVTRLWQEAPTQAARIDEQMYTSVTLAIEALAKPDAEQGLPLLTKAMDMACDCFDQWGLITPALRQHMALLEQRGALAVKPTGSGGGGYVLSAWSTPPAIPEVDFISL
jgi:mevalonate kinase